VDENDTSNDDELTALRYGSDNSGDSDPDGPDVDENDTSNDDELTALDYGNDKGTDDDDDGLSPIDY